jgi:hypothetical protein
MCKRKAPANALFALYRLDAWWRVCLGGRGRLQQRLLHDERQRRDRKRCARVVGLYALYTAIVLVVLALHVYAFITSLFPMKSKCARYPVTKGTSTAGGTVKHTTPSTSAVVKNRRLTEREKCLEDFVHVCIAGGFGVVCAGVLGVLQIWVWVVEGMFAFGSRSSHAYTSVWEEGKGEGGSVGHCGDVGKCGECGGSGGIAEESKRDWGNRRSRWRTVSLGCLVP